MNFSDKIFAINSDKEFETLALALFRFQAEHWSLEDWQQEIDLALKYGLKHISLYQLTIEEGTIFHKKNVKVMDENSSVTFYNQTVSYLREKGLDRYEVSNFAKSKQDGLYR